MSRQAWLFIAAILLFAFGGCSLVQSDRVQEQADGLPKLTCDQLIQNGPAGNNFLKLTDVRLCSGGYAFRRDMDADMVMYMPVYSAQLPKEPRPGDLRLVLEIFDDRERTRLLAQPDVGELTCELWTRADQLHPWVCETLAAKYPGIRIKKCRVLSVGLHEPTPAKAREIWWYAIISFAIGTGILIWLAWKRSQMFIHSESLDLQDQAV
jgi:hypothetical protein